MITYIVLILIRYNNMKNENKINANNNFTKLRFGAILAVSLMVLGTTPAFALDLNFTAVSTPFNTPIGIDHFEPTNEVVISVNYASGNPYNFETVASNGTHAQFSTLSGFTNEVKIATARDDGVNSFASGTLFTGNGIDGQIVMINPDATFVNPWVDLPGAGNGLMRGSLYVDRTGVYNGDLIVVTTGGEVWRIDSAANATMIADVNVHLEGLVTVPDDPRYGDMAGKILAGAEQQSLVHAFDNTGLVASWTTSDFQIEDIDMIPENENFFGVNFGTNRLLGVPAGSFDGMEGEILITDEFFSGFSGLALLKWDNNTNAPIVETIGVESGSFVPGQWEHVTFSTAGIVEIPPPFIEVEIDIKPGSDPSCFNNDGNGVIPVAIFGTATFDVNDIDVETVQLEGLDVNVVGKSNKLLASIEDVNEDGYDDLVVKIEDEDGVFDVGSTMAILTGSLLDGTQIQGTGDICITQ